MIRKPFAAFGRVLYANYYENGYTVDTVTYADSQTVLLFTEGSITVRDKVTGSVAYECVPGYIKYGDYRNGLYVSTANAPSVSWCYDPKVNQGYVPPMELVALKTGEAIELPQGTRLFLCSGTLVINGVAHVAPRQISVKSASVTAAATTDVYGLNFK
tara:strand:- start:414 stop:887 length:474 start_codon:yes stop_codon:yes gene_type:complete